MERKRLFGLFAHPAGHSMSPLMHNAAFNHLGLEHYYQAFDVHPEQLRVALASIKALGIGGVNVSIPHKEAVLPFLDEVEEEARVIGAVNTIVLGADGHLRGYNTDGAGYVHSLLAETNLDLTEANILILGAGGAAKGIGVYLLKHGCRRLTIANRTMSKALQLKMQLEEYGAQQANSAQVETLDWAVLERSDLAAYTVLINTTPLGMWPHMEQSPFSLENISADVIVSDIVYNPLETLFLQEAKAKGARIHQGLGMFVYQGALAFKLFTGQEAPVEVMKHVVLDKLLSEAR